MGEHFQGTEMAQHLKDTGQHNDDTHSGNTERRVDTFRTLRMGQHFRTLRWVNTSGQ